MLFIVLALLISDDIQIRFYEESDDESIWESYAEFGACDVHRQVWIRVWLFNANSSSAECAGLLACRNSKPNPLQDNESLLYWGLKS